MNDPNNNVTGGAKYTHVHSCDDQMQLDQIFHNQLRFPSLLRIYQETKYE